ncbi:INO80 complex subunit C-like [Corticium candelabrum]|uniref:INO80 complex subunit C-like n=1 Tax=Corticium candelabrum TaxID=121492 RepID=UPI002E2625F8|nr:INO80 complex subunit C-like [Corticium candelabrum]
MSSRKKKNHRTISPVVQSSTSKRRKKHRVTWEEFDYYEDNPRPSREGDRTKQSQTKSTTNRFCFKDQNFAFRQGAMNKKRVWKNLKQILGNERMLPWQQDDPTYSSIDAPPSFKPAKKYSDLFGLLATYQDPQTGMRYSTPNEFAIIRSLPSDIVQSYLAIRKASTV